MEPGFKVAVVTGATRGLGRALVDEAVFFSSENGGDFLYLYSRAPDLARAAAAFESSIHAVDVEFRRIMAECLDVAAAKPLELLFATENRARG